MTSAIPLELVLVSVVIFVAVLIFVRIHDHFELPELGAESDEPFFNISEPNRRNQSVTPPSAYTKKGTIWYTLYRAVSLAVPLTSPTLSVRE